VRPYSFEGVGAAVGGGVLGMPFGAVALVLTQKWIEVMFEAVFVRTILTFERHGDVEGAEDFKFLREDTVIVIAAGATQNFFGDGVWCGGDLVRNFVRR